MKDLKLEHILGCHTIMKTDVEKAENTTLYCKDDKKLIDFEAGMWSTALGHCNPRVNAVMIDQINKVINAHYKLTNDIAEALAIKLLKQVQFQDGKAVFLSSGSEAVEFAIRISRLISKKSKVLTFSTTFLSAYSSTSIPRDKNLWDEVDFVQCYKCASKQCTYQCSMLKNIDFNDIAAFAFESATCGAVLFPPYKLVKFLANEVKSHGGLILANEVTTGFGRSGKWFGYNHYDIEPDIISMGKSLGNGYPISAVVMKKTVADEVESRNFRYAQSHQNNPLGCAVGNEVMNILIEDNMVDVAKNTGDFFLQQLKEVKDSCSVVKDVRGKGLMLALELNVDNATEVVAEKMLEKGYFIGTTPNWNTLRFFPAFTISRNQITDMCLALKNVLKVLEYINPNKILEFD